MSMANNNRRLFPHSTRSSQLAQVQRQSAQLLNRIQREIANPTPRTLQEIEQHSRELSRLASGTDAAFTESYRRTLRAIDRYSRSQTGGGMFSQLLRALGTPGRAVADWLRGREGQQLLRPIQQQVESAMQQVHELNPELLPTSPEEAGGRLVNPPDDSSTGQPPAGGGGGGRNRLPPAAPPQGPPDDDSPHPNVRIMPDGRWRIRGPGYLRTLNPDHPALTGRMVPVTSSNVHSIGYVFNFDAPLRGTMMVRYWQRNRAGSGRVPGPTYEYLRIHPDFFDDLWIQASSKGRWIWDNIRIRGTVAGHQYSYNLARAAQNYLPRRARVVNGRQVLERRRRVAERRDGSRYVLTSPLPTEYIGAYRPQAHRPNVGNPDRGNVRLRR